jgi:hypothetical protein
MRPVRSDIHLATVGEIDHDPKWDESANGHDSQKAQSDRDPINFLEG